MSGRKDVLFPFTLVAAVSMGGDITSTPIDVQNIDNVGLQVAWTSANAVGVISVQGSLDYKPTNPPTAGTWYDLTFDPALTQPASDNGGYLINLNQVPYTWLRLKYTRTSGTGTLTAYACGKMV